MYHPGDCFIHVQNEELHLLRFSLDIGCIQFRNNALDLSRILANPSGWVILAFPHLSPYAPNQVKT